VCNCQVTLIELAEAQGAAQDSTRVHRGGAPPQRRSTRSLTPPAARSQAQSRSQRDLDPMPKISGTMHGQPASPISLRCPPHPSLGALSEGGSRTCHPRANRLQTARSGAWPEHDTQEDQRGRDRERWYSPLGDGPLHAPSGTFILNHSKRVRSSGGTPDCPKAVWRLDFLFLELLASSCCFEGVFLLF